MKPCHWPIKDMQSAKPVNTFQFLNSVENVAVSCPSRCELTPQDVQLVNGNQAGLAQLVEHLPSKQDVASSTLVPRSIILL